MNDTNSSSSRTSTAHYAQGLGGIIASGMWADKHFERSGSASSFFPPAYTPSRMPSRQLSEPFSPPSHMLHNSFTCRNEANIQATEPLSPKLVKAPGSPAPSKREPKQKSGATKSKAVETPNEARKESTNTNNNSKADWICIVCGNKNYSWRHVCNMRKCRAPKPGHLTSQPLPPGSWACLNCGNLNYAERTVCNMRKCKSPRPTTQKQSRSDPAGEVESEQIPTHEQKRSSSEKSEVIPEHVSEYALWDAVSHE